MWVYITYIPLAQEYNSGKDLHVHVKGVLE